MGPMEAEAETATAAITTKPENNPKPIVSFFQQWFNLGLGEWARDVHAIRLCSNIELLDDFFVVWIIFWIFRLIAWWMSNVTQISTPGIYVEKFEECCDVYD